MSAVIFRESADEVIRGCLEIRSQTLELQSQLQTLYNWIPFKVTDPQTEPIFKEIFFSRNNYFDLHKFSLIFRIFNIFLEFAKRERKR